MSDHYTAQVVADAQVILKRLLLKGSLARNDALYQKYVGPGQQDVRALLEDLARDWNGALIDAPDGLFFFPAPGNTDIGMTAELLRQRLGVRMGTASELNLALFVMIAVIALLQGDSGAERLARVYITEQELIQFVDSKLVALAEMDDAPALETEYALDIRGMAGRWNEMQTADPRDPNRTQHHRQGFCRKILRLWEEEDLVLLEADGRIFARPRLQAAFSRFYKDRQRIRYLLSLLSATKEAGHANA